MWTDEDKLMTVALDAGAEDIKTDDPEVFQVLTAPADFDKVKERWRRRPSPASAEVTFCRPPRCP
ncbi:MAG: YebC/PmpR family DNA-binding transcriptional regulator [Elusimicrobia bacterium]|nr:YebC/PmpR family DNA-binding transcriptional regulator [Elusimicrobiota bacterium]